MVGKTISNYIDAVSVTYLLNANFLEELNHKFDLILKMIKKFCFIFRQKSERLKYNDCVYIFNLRLVVYLSNAIVYQTFNS